MKLLLGEGTFLVNYHANHFPMNDPGKSLFDGRVESTSS